VLDQRPMNGERHRNDDLAAPAPLPATAVAAAPLLPGWGLEQLQIPGAALSAEDVAVVAPEDRSGGSGSAPAAPVLRPSAGTDGLFAWDHRLPPDDLASEADPAKGPRGATQGLDATAELAFGAHLLPLEAAKLPGGPGDALPSLPLASGSARTPADCERTQPDNKEGAASSHSALSTSLDGVQTESQNSATPGDARGSSRPPEDGHVPPAPAPRAAGPIGSSETKGGASNSDHSPGDRGENAPARQTDTGNVWSTAATPASREAPSAVSVQQPEGARSTGPELPEPAGHPASRDVSLHLAGGDNGVDIRMAERAGEIRVTVHTTDRDLANSLRADLPDLVGKLRQSGFQAETWRPAAAAQSDASRRSGSDGSTSQEHSPGARRDGRQQQSPQQQPKNQSRWAGEWKSSLDPAQESHI